VTELSRFAFEVLRKDEHFILYRGRNKDGSSQILLRSPTSQHPTLQNIKRLEQAYSLKEELDPAWAVRAIEFAWHWDRTVLVLEDPGGVPLDQLIGQPLDLAFSLRIAISLLSAGRYLPGATHARERASPRVHQSGPTPQTSPYRRRTLVNARGTGVDLGEAPTLS
jgi:hypothetical protein